MIFSFLTKKNILIISPQKWAKNKVSKHHYAIELSKLSNQVYFVNPPVTKLFRFGFAIEEVDRNLWTISISYPLPYWTKFKLKGLYNYFVRNQFRQINHLTQPDILWNFDNETYFKFEDIFSECLKIYHPVDAFNFQTINNRINQYDICYSVSDEILKNINAKFKHFINHGLNDEFVEFAKKQYAKIEEPITNPKNIKAGYVGNLSIKFLDRNTLKAAIAQNPLVEFNFFGSYQKNDPFIAYLQTQSNCKLHGIVTGLELYEKLRTMDFLILCYLKQEGYFGDNSHKLIEYLSTGKTIISSQLTSYKSTSLFYQSDDNENSDYTELLHNVVEKITTNNSIENQKNRIRYAIESAYINRLMEIENILSQLDLQAV